MSDTESTTIFQAPDIPEVSQLFPAYEIHSLIACGGMGAVYHATQKSLDRAVAIKILPRVFSNDEEFRQSFESEAKAMAKLNHPNLIGVYDFGEAGGMLYIVMEYVDGQSLYHAAHGQAVDAAEAMRIVMEICHGLSHAHEYGVLHRDIKPANILLDSNVSPKIGDFGLARAMEQKIEEGEQIYGTPGYTAPEVLQPPYTFDQRADIFSVGVVLHELLTGMLPDADPRPASQLSGCSPRLDAVIRKATDPDPNLRYLSAEELAKELKTISRAPAGGLLAPASRGVSGSPLYAPRKYVAKKDSSAGLVITLLVVGAGIIGLLVVVNQKPGAAELPDVPGEVVQQSVQAPPAVSEEVVAGDDGANVEPVAAVAAFDVPGFLSQTRRNMRTRIGPLLEAQKLEFAANARKFEDDMGVLIRRLESEERGEYRELLKQELELWKSGDSRVPASFDGKLASLSGATELREEVLEQQAAIERKLERNFRSQAGIYVLELENELEKQREGGDQAAISGLQREIDRVKSDDGYFRSLFK